ncbi:MAG: hypothetical protein FK734_19460 [Asgard group archaeon]|nr:hypothetical protein [Asgard group archaeon]
MKKKTKKCIMHLTIVFVILFSMISMIHSEMSLNIFKVQGNNYDPKTSNDFLPPVIADVTLSDDMLELRDILTITCKITDESAIAFVYLTI